MKGALYPTMKGLCIAIKDSKGFAGFAGFPCESKAFPHDGLHPKTLYLNVRVLYWDSLVTPARVLAEHSYRASKFVRLAKSKDHTKIILTLRAKD